MHTREEGQSHMLFSAVLGLHRRRSIEAPPLASLIKTAVLTHATALSLVIALLNTTFFSSPLPVYPGSETPSNGLYVRSRRLAVNPDNWNQIGTQSGSKSVNKTHRISRDEFLLWKCTTFDTLSIRPPPDREFYNNSIPHSESGYWRIE